MPARRPASPAEPQRRGARRGLGHDDVLPVDPDLAPDDASEPSSATGPRAHVRRSRQSGVLIAIMSGGSLGALARYELELSWPSAAGHFPWATFTINTSGALFLGAVLTILLSRPRRLQYLRPFLCVGFTGAWTTMSTFALETDLLVKDGRVLTALGYVGSTVVLGVLAASVGIAVGRRAQRRGATWSLRSR
jgi:CrcB protein